MYHLKARPQKEASSCHVKRCQNRGLYPPDASACTVAIVSTIRPIDRNKTPLLLSGGNDIPTGRDVHTDGKLAQTECLKKSRRAAV
jgi:hypothetical protein